MVTCEVCHGEFNKPLDMTESVCLGCRQELHRRFQRYRVTPDQYARALREQEHRCGICKAEAELYVDKPDHTLRGLLCMRCLSASKIWSTADICRSAADYLQTEVLTAYEGRPCKRCKKETVFEEDFCRYCKAAMVEVEEVPPNVLPEHLKGDLPKYANAFRNKLKRAGYTEE